MTTDTSYPGLPDQNSRHSPNEARTRNRRLRLELLAYYCRKPYCRLRHLCPRVPLSCVGSEIFWLGAGAFVGQETVPARGRASLVALGHRGRLRTWTREMGGSCHRHRTRKRSGRQLQRLLPLPQARPQFWLLKTMETWRCTYRPRAGSRTARRSLYIDTRRRSSIHRAMRRDANAGAARAARCCRASVAQSGAIVDRRRGTPGDDHRSSIENDSLGRLLRCQRRVMDWVIPRGRPV